MLYAEMYVFIWSINDQEGASVMGNFVHALPWPNTWGNLYMYFYTVIGSTCSVSDDLSSIKNTV